jgi:hypothetical protein
VLSNLKMIRIALISSLVLSLLASPISMQQSISADWPVISSASLENANPKVGDVIKWKVAVDCFDTGLIEINVLYQDPLGEIQSANSGNVINPKVRPTKGEYEVPLKITEQAPNGNYQVLSVGVQCVGLENGRYQFGGFQGNLRTLDFKLVGNNKFSQDTPPRIDSLRLISADTVSKGERIIIGAKVSKLAFLDSAYIVLEGPEEKKTDCKGPFQSKKLNVNEWELTFGCTVTDRLSIGTWKIGFISVGGKAGLNVDQIDYNNYPFNSTDQAGRQITLSQSTSTPSVSVPNSPIQSTAILSTFNINVVELSPTAAAKVAAAAKLQQEAGSKSQVLPLLSTPKLISAIVRKFGKANSTLLATTECWRDLEKSDKDFVTLDIQGLVGKTWNSLDSDVRWIQGNQIINCPSGYGPILSAPVITNQSSFQFSIKQSDQEYFANAVKVSDESYPRANIETFAVALLDLSDLESLKKEQEDESKAAAELNAKLAADANAAAELKAKAEATAKALAAKKKSTITCVKGKLTKKVTAIKPVCPAGYKKKA